MSGIKVSRIYVTDNVQYQGLEWGSPFNSLKGNDIREAYSDTNNVKK